MPLKDELQGSLLPMLLVQPSTQRRLVRARSAERGQKCSVESVRTLRFASVALCCLRVQAFVQSRAAQLAGLPMGAVTGHECGLVRQARRQGHASLGHHSFAFLMENMPMPLPAPQPIPPIQPPPQPSDLPPVETPPNPIWVPDPPVVDPPPAPGESPVTDPPPSGPGTGTPPVVDPPPSYH